MPPKKKVAAPIDRPLSRAYLREFTGWSTAFSPGLSEPTSLRQMENVLINRDGSLRVRPGLKYLSYETLPEEGVTGLGVYHQVVGSHEAFFLNDGTKAYLFAVREDDGKVGFRVLSLLDDGAAVSSLTAHFSVPQGEAVLNFSSATTYVRYLQIDNKVFALSDAGETMRLFTVGVSKQARKLSAIERPEWSVADKLTVVKPDAPWITSGVPVGTRTNLMLAPSFEVDPTYVDDVWPFISTKATRLETPDAKRGTSVLKMESLPQRTNLITNPLRLPQTNGITGWYASTGMNSVYPVPASSTLRSQSDTGTAGRFAYLGGPLMPVTAGTFYEVTYDLSNIIRLSALHTRVVFYDSSGTLISDQLKAVALTDGRKYSGTFNPPIGAVTMRIYIRATCSGTTAASYFDIRNIVLNNENEPTDFFDGDSGANYFWTGTPHASASVYHPPQGLITYLHSDTVTPGQQYTGSLYMRAGSVGRDSRMTLQFLDSGGAAITSKSAPAVALSNSAWTLFTVTDTAPAGAVKAWLVPEVVGAVVPRGEYHMVDEVMLEAAAAKGTYFDGATTNTATLKYAWKGAAHKSASTETTYSIAGTIPTAETPTANTLISSDKTKNVYNVAYFYTFNNDVGESAASQITQVLVQRRHSSWKWETANALGEPSGTDTTNPDLAADQLVAFMPESVYLSAKAQGARSWNLYMLTWSDQDVVPVEGMLLESKPITESGNHGSEGWIRHTPATIQGNSSMFLPTEKNRVNYTVPSSGGQGLVASDRMVMVYDPADPAVIRWSSSRTGEYTNFSASVGGGKKTLTSGNLFVPAAVKLWQNPQSVDTLTVLCMGVDGYSTSYYMAPAAITSQTDTTQLMGFEETTSTPGTCSPYGVEVLNNALYHPLETELMKSTASNYNINHKSMTDKITNMWTSLLDKDKIVSAQLDNRLYYLVNNRYGDTLEPGCWGNEVWVFDVAAENGHWSRWKVQGCSLRKIEFAGRSVMSISRPDGIYCFDDLKGEDDVVIDQEVLTAPIAWCIETNTQGANRAHDAWAHLQQVNLTLGSFLGKMKYGVRGYNQHGKKVEVSKIVQDGNEASADGLPWDLEDYLLVREDMKEWRFFAGSVEVDGVLQPSSGQLSLVQYRYTPVSVNVGYEYGSVETFEYGRNVAVGNDGRSFNGVPVPYIDSGRP